MSHPNKGERDVYLIIVPHNQLFYSLGPLYVLEIAIRYSRLNLGLLYVLEIVIRYSRPSLGPPYILEMSIKYSK
jgi:hypothetical protein